MKYQKLPRFICLILAVIMLCSVFLVSCSKEEGKEGFITKIHERKNSLIRPAVANVDLLCVVIAAKNPDPDLFILDKLCAVAKHNGIEVTEPLSFVVLVQIGDRYFNALDPIEYLVISLNGVKFIPLDAFSVPSKR